MWIVITHDENEDTYEAQIVSAASPWKAARNVHKLGKVIMMKSFKEMFDLLNQNQV